MIRRFAIVLATVVLAATSYAGDAKPNKVPRDAFKTKTRSVAVFKDGYGFFMRQGQAFLRDGWCMTDFIPKATAGTFWLYASEPNCTVTTVRSTRKNNILFDNPEELISALEGKLGLQLKIQTEDTTVEGELDRVLEDMLLVKSGKQLQIVRLEDIKSVQIVGQPLLMKVESKGRLEQVTMNIGYLQGGISWVPSYIAELSGTDKLRLTLRGTITNGVEDLEGCTIYLVVGVPNFSLRGQLDPLTVHALGSAVVTSMPSAYMNVAQSFRDFKGDAVEELTLEPAGHSVNMPVEGLKELYYYELTGVDMSAGDVVMSTVMVGEVPYRSLYVWDANAGEDILHHIVLKNSLASPLTTGPVMVMDQGRPVSQDQLNYTSVGSESRVKITIAGDVRGEAVDTEIERGPQEEIMRVSYIPVESQGKLTVSNRKKESVEVEITRKVTGKVTLVSDDGQATSQAKTEDGLNPETSLKWTIKVAAGKDRTVTYRYLRYVRAQAR